MRGDRTSPPEILESLQRGVFYLSETHGSTLAGCVYVEVKARLGYLGLLAVDPTVQGRGTGRAPMAVGERHCRAEGCQRAELWVVNLRRELPPFYRRLGYEPTGVEPFIDVSQLKLECHFIVMSKALVR